MFESVADQVGRRPDAELLHEAAAVGADRLDTERQFVGDVRYRLAGGQQAKHFMFTIGQPLVRWTGPIVLRELRERRPDFFVVDGPARHSPA